MLFLKYANNNNVYIRGNNSPPNEDQSCYFQAEAKSWPKTSSLKLWKALA